MTKWYTWGRKKKLSTNDRLERGLSNSWPWVDKAHLFGWKRRSSYRVRRNTDRKVNPAWNAAAPEYFNFPSIARIRTGETARCCHMLVKNDRTYQLVKISDIFQRAKFGKTAREKMDPNTQQRTSSLIVWEKECGILIYTIEWKYNHSLTRM